MRWMWLVLATACTGEEPVSQGSVSVLTYNVQGLPDALSESDRPTLDRMLDISPLLNGYDIVGVQEDFNDDWHAALVGEAQHGVVQHMDDRLDERVYSSGLSLLSRVGGEAGYAEHFYTSCYGVLDHASDCLASKGFQVLTVQLAEGARVVVANTHLEAGSGVEDDAVRAEQVSELIAALPSSDAVIVMGDTNLRPSDPPDAEVLLQFEAAGLEDVCTLVQCDEDDHIDRVLIRSGAVRLTAAGWSREAQLVDVDGADLSDHPGISAQIGWSIEP